MKEETFWVVGEGLLSMRRPWPTLGVKNWGVTWRI